MLELVRSPRQKYPKVANYYSLLSPHHTSLAQTRLPLHHVVLSIVLLSLVPKPTPRILLRHHQHRHCPHSLRASPLLTRTSTSTLVQARPPYHRLSPHPRPMPLSLSTSSLASTTFMLAFPAKKKSSC
jgi:hypothetical protein